VQTMQSTQNAEMIRSLSIALIVFGTLAAALAVAATRREGPGLLGRLSEFFFGDLRKKPLSDAARTAGVSAAPTGPEQQPAAKATRREIDNFDLSIFEDF
jgi:hypothetical protein